MTTQFLNIIPHYKELKLLREMAESRSEAERVQGKPAMLVVLASKKAFRDYWEPIKQTKDPE